MEKNGKFYQYRERLDRTLASPALTDLDELKTLISKQLEGSDEKLIEKRAMEASNFLDMLRGAGVSGNEDSQRTKAAVGEWNLKESNEEFRVMYREGPQGTPMHTLFVEGYVDGPTDTCLCLGWESTLYHKWWPQFNFPNFKIALSKSLQRVRFGEQISLLRMKIAWPLSARESVLHYFMFEYLEEGLVVVLLNSISDSDSIDVKTHGYTSDGIPKPEDVVRMDLVGGFAVQRVSSERSYVCLMANIDFKLDFMPPSLINFLARQLIGGGYKLYQKAVVSTSKHDKDYVKALRDPLYARLRDILRQSSEEPLDVVKGREELNSNQSVVEATKVAAQSLMGVEQNGEGNPMIESFADALDDLDEKAYGDIEEEEKSEVLKNGATTNMSLEACTIEYTVVNEAFGSLVEADSEDEDEDEDACEPRYLVQYAIVLVCPDINQAIGKLEKGISLARRCGVSVLTRPFYRPNNRGRSPNAVSPSAKKTSKLGAFARKHTTPLKDEGAPSNSEVSVAEVSKLLMEKAPDGIRTYGSYIDSRAESESGKPRDGESRNVIYEIAMEGSEEEKSDDIDYKRGRRLRKRRYLTACFGYQ